MRRLRRASGAILSAAMLAAAVVTCPCAADTAATREEQGCCGPKAGVVLTTDCCLGRPTPAPVLTAPPPPAPDLWPGAPVAEPVVSPVTPVRSRVTTSSPSPPTPSLRI